MDISKEIEDVKQQGKATQAQIEETFEDLKSGDTPVQRNLDDSLDQAKASVSHAVEGTKSAPAETTKGITRQMANPTDAPTVDPAAIKRRLDWGEPALTILDVRQRADFNQERIRGAVPVAAENLAEQVPDMLEMERDIFVYGETDVETAQAVNTLISLGYTRVAGIAGNLAGWKAVDAPTEGIQQ